MMSDPTKVGDLLPKHELEPKPPTELVPVERHCGICGTRYSETVRSDFAPAVPLERRRLGLCTACRPKPPKINNDHDLRPRPRTGGY